ncbi:MAG: NAD(+) synthase [Actinobacteria bacterium]|nr:MAG: NAD(+) synthase [Actinomycetota bacterium]
MSFLDVRQHGFARVAVCVPPVRVADPLANAEAHVRFARRVHDEGARYAVFPELGLPGYTCGDLFFQRPLLDACLDALAVVARETASLDVMLSVGVPLVVDDALYNCAATIYGGRVVAVHPKSYPPNYREFYELRWFQPATQARSTHVVLAGESVPFGADVLIRHGGIDGFVLHTEVCEDLWVPVPPSTIAALSGATVLANLSASNVTIGKWEYRHELVAMSSAKNLAVQLYSAAGFGESTSDLAWDGHGMIADRGDVLTQTDRYVLDGSVSVVDVDLMALLEDRIRQTSFAQNAREHAAPVRVVDVAAIADTRPASTFETLRRFVTPLPFVPTDVARRDERCREIFQITSTSLARRIDALPADARHCIVGVSGGRDSTHALLVAVHAMDLLGLPRSSVIGVTMPGFGTTDATYGAACDLIRTLACSFREIEIRSVSSDVFSAVGHDPAVENLTFENVQAWARKFMLFSVASQEKGIDIGTGDLSELALGFATYGGDHMSHYGVNAGIPKTLITTLIAWASEQIFADEPAVQEVLGRIQGMPVSPELLRPNIDGTIRQRSEDLVGPYELHDFFLYHFLRFGFGPQRIARLALHAFEGGYDLATIRRWLLVFLRRFFANQFKRDCVPDSPKIGSGGSLSPRGDWRMPSDAAVEVWIREAEAIG